ncbi:MAG TPA: hypothetical protein VFV89_14575 [Nocardioides sp.]|uniref:hypothetical protein n=1 Tax=Nocardioides sp. TaxID=35761 RepID=UPI002E2F5BAB|nr:hypothetical protein [Nocardioides sp.]HEX5089029.1 hypothetical protein [Nocardioides sp.]
MVHRSPASHPARLLGVLALLALVPLQEAAAAPAGADASRAATTPKVLVALEKSRITTRQHARVRVVVDTPAGVTNATEAMQQKTFGRVKVVVRGGGKTRQVLATMAGHRTVVGLPKLPRGFYKVRAEFLGNAALDAASSRYKKLMVVRGGAGGDGGPSGFPDAGSTGVPAGISLKPYTGPCTITTDNTVIDSRTVGCTITVKAKNVVIRNSSLRNVWLDQDEMHALGRSGWSVSIADSTVDAGTADGPGVCCGNYDVLRVEMKGGHNGAQCENGASYCNLTDSWIHGQYEPAGGQRHLGGFLNDGGTPSTLVHNSITCDAPAQNDEGGCTGDVNLIPNFGVMANVTVERNWFGANANSAYCTYAGATPGLASYAQQSNHIVYRDNVFERADSIADPAPGQPGKTRRCAAYGPVTGFDPNGAGNVWSGNTYDDGTVVKPAR